MKASAIAKQLREMARLRNLEGGVHGHAIGYHNAAKAVAELGNREITSSSQLKDVKFVGPKTLEKVDELLKTGRLAAVRENAPLLKSHHRSKSPAAQQRRREGEVAKRSPAKRRQLRSPPKNSLFSEVHLNNLA